MLLGSEWGTGQMTWSFLWFAVMFLWVWLVIKVFADIVRSPDLSGVAKALWTLFIIVIPFIGVAIYLIAHGEKLGRGAVQSSLQKDMAANRAAFGG